MGDEEVVMDARDGAYVRWLALWGGLLGEDRLVLVEDEEE